MLRALATSVARSHGLRVLVIKGSSLNHHRLRERLFHADVDVLVDPDDVEPFLAGMAANGWRARMGKYNDYPVRNHSVTLIHDNWPADLDVHRVFPGFLRDASEVFDKLWSRREEMISANQPVEITDFASSVLVLALHSARSKAENPRHAQELAHLVKLAADWTEEQRADVAELARATGSSQALDEVLPLMGVSVSTNDGASPADLARWRQVIHGEASSLEAWRANLAQHSVLSWPGLVWHAIWPSEEFLRATSRIPPNATDIDGIRLKRLTDGAARIGRALKVKLGWGTATTPVSAATQSVESRPGEPPLVSVVIPVYNTAAYVSECLVSVLAQTHWNLEIICVDDGSTDDSLALLERVAESDPRVRVVKREHQGVGATRNVGIEEASGELLTFVDSDDVVSPTLVETLVSALGHTDAVMSGWPREGRIVDSATAIAEGIRLGTLNMHGKLLRTEVLRDHTVLFEEDLSLREDIIFNAGYLLQARRITLLPEQLYKHRPRPGSLTTAYRPHKYEELTSANSRLAGLTGHLHTPEFASLINYLQIRSLISAGLNLHHPDSQVPSTSAARLLRTWQRDAGDLPVRHGDPKMRVVGLLYNALGLTGTVSPVHRLKGLRAKLTR